MLKKQFYQIHKETEASYRHWLSCYITRQEKQGMGPNRKNDGNVPSTKKTKQYRLLQKSRYLPEYLQFHYIRARIHGL